MCFTRNKSVLFAIVLALITVSTVFIIMSDQDSSAASRTSVNDATGLIAAINGASDGDVIVVTADIELNSPLPNIKKKITLTADKEGGATIRPSGAFVSNIYTNMIRVDAPNGGQLTLGEPGSTDSNNILTLDGVSKCRVLFVDKGTFTLNSGVIINGKSYAGCGIWLGNGADFVMNGGLIERNTIDPNYKYNGYVFCETDAQYSKDVWCSAGTTVTMNGGVIDMLFENANTTDSDYILMNGGTIRTLYISSDGSNGSTSKFVYMDGNVGQLLLSTMGNDGEPNTYNHTEVRQLKQNAEYVAGSHIAKVGKYGYDTLQEAYDAASNGGEIMILGDYTISESFVNEKNITFVREYNYNTGAPYVLNFKVSVNLGGGIMDVPAGWTDSNGSLIKEYPLGTSLADIVGELGEASGRSGYAFDSWSYTNGSLGSVSPTITAIYNAKEYDIHLHHGDEGDSHGKAKVTFDGTIANIIDHAIRDGYRLIGYFTHQSGGTMVLNADGTFASHNINEHITDGKWSKDAHHTLYAQWEADIADTVTKDIEYLKDHYLPYAAIITAAEALLVIGIAMLIRRR